MYVGLRGGYTREQVDRTCRSVERTTKTYSAGFDFVPSDKVSFGASLGREKYTALQPPPIVNELQRGTFDARYCVSGRAAVGVVYGFDRYRVDDFALGPVASLVQRPQRRRRCCFGLLLPAIYRQQRHITAHIFFVMFLT